MIDYETYTQEQREWIVNFCNKEILVDDSLGSKNWIWPVRPHNWPVLRDKKVWAVGKKGKGSIVQKGDRIIFYKNESGFFVGAYNVKSDWHDRTVVWPDQEHGSEVMTTGAEIDLEEIQLGFASWNKLFPDLKYVEK